MAAYCYPEAIRRVLLSEGGYVNLKSDPGGPTNYGITLAVYRANGHPEARDSDVKAMPLDEAKRIYKARYASPCGFDMLPAGLDYTVFDYAVNSGVGRANKVLRRVCSLPDTADFGSVVTALAKRDPKAVIGAVNAERLKFLQGLSTWSTFGKGWGSRVKSVNEAARGMADLKDAPIPSALPPVADSAGKGQVPEPDAARKVIVGGPVVGGVTAGASLWDWVASHPSITFVIGLCGVICIAFALNALNRWHVARQEAPTPGIIPVPEKAGG